MRSITVALSMLALGLVGAGCGSSSDEQSSGTTGTAKQATTVPAGRLGAASPCTVTVGGGRAAMTSCSSGSALSQEQWIAKGKKGGESFVAWGEEKQFSGKSGIVVATCPAGAKLRATKAPVERGVDGGLAASSTWASASLHLDPANSISVGFSGAATAPVWARAWAMCVGV